MQSHIRSILPAVLLLVLAAPGSSEAQYFGQNKVRYETLDFKVLETEHFDIYYYDEERNVIEDVGRMAERWYFRLSRILHHELVSRQPLIIYASSTAFRATTAVPEDIGETTGGLTEGLRRRVILPLAGSPAETDHVLGHELVHAFQYDIFAGVPEGSAELGPQLPLWFVEGMAEYLSLGPADAQTAMWLRDAVRRNDVPAIRKLDKPRYFPYRFGHAFWSFVAGRFGDESVGRILKAGARTGDPVRAIESSLETSVDVLDREWRSELSQAYDPILKAAGKIETMGHPLVGSIEDDASDSLNLAPVLSPDGRLMILFTAGDRLSIDLYLADAETGRILQKITRSAIDAHFDSLQFAFSSGAWTTDGKRFAFGAVSGGRPEIAIYDVEKRSVEKRIRLAAFGEIPCLSWSPDGRQIVFSGTLEGTTDLFLLDVESGTTRQLTHDAFADFQPAWSPDGREIAFVTDRFTGNLSSLTYGDYRLALVDVNSGEVREVHTFDDGLHINPQWAPDGGSLYFVSDRDGVANIYRITLAGGALRQLTNVQTGVGGITRTSPTLSVALKAERIAFSVFGNGNYAVYKMEGPALQGTPVSRALDNLHAGILPPFVRRTKDITTYLESPGEGLPSADQFVKKPYRARLSLENIAPPQVSVGVSSYGALVGGGTAFQWGDLLGYHSLTTVLQSTITSGGGNFFNSIGALAIYQNQRSRWTWGVGGGQIPYMTEGFTRSLGAIDGQPAIIDQSVTLWEIDREMVGTVSYPFNRARRVEFSLGFQNISFDARQRTAAASLTTGNLLLDESLDLPTPASIRFGRTGAALVYDTSIFGGVSPISGQSYRLEYGLSAGNLTYSTALADYRRYFRIARTMTLAGRVLHYGRYGSGAEDSRLQDVFIGYPNLVRGYDSGSFTSDECGEANQTGACPVVDRLLGSRLAIANAELRIPLLGYLGVIPSRSIPPVEAALFYDAGVAWRSTETLFDSRKPVTSYGTSIRFNILGFAIGQLSYVHPNNRPLKNWVWEFGFTPGF